MKSKIEIILFLTILVAILIPRLLLEINFPLCCGWDIPYYPAQLYNYDILNSPDEPLIFLLAKTLEPLFGNFGSFRILHIVAFAIFGVGSYFLIKKHFGFKIAIIILLLIGLLPVITRIWSDLYRNFLAISFIPFFIYFFEGFDKKHWLVAAALLGLIGLTHRLVFVFIILGIVIYFILRSIKRPSKQIFIKCFLVGFIGTLLFLPYFYKEYILLAPVRISGGISNQADLLLSWKEIPSFWIIAETSAFLIIPALGVILIFFFKKLDEIKDVELIFISLFLCSLLFAFGFFGTPFVIYFRYQLLAAFFSLFIFAIYLSELNLKYPSTLKEFLPICILIIFLAISIYYGINFLLIQGPLLTESEFKALITYKEVFSANDTGILVTSRLHRWIEALLPEKKLNETLFVAEWYCLTNELPRSDPRCGDNDLAFNGNLNQSIKALENIKNKHGLEKIYMIWTDGLEPISREKIIEKEKAGVINIFAWKEGDVIHPTYVALFQ